MLSFHFPNQTKILPPILNSNSEQYLEKHFEPENLLDYSRHLHTFIKNNEDTFQKVFKSKSKEVDECLEELGDFQQALSVSFKQPNKFIDMKKAKK